MLVQSLLQAGEGTVVAGQIAMTPIADLMCKQALVLTALPTHSLPWVGALLLHVCATLGTTR